MLLAITVCFLLAASPQILTACELGELSLRWVNAPEPIAWDQRVPYAVYNEFSNYPTSVLPYLNMARNPSMAIAIFHLGAAGLTAFGLDACCTDRE